MTFFCAEGLYYHSNNIQFIGSIVQMNYFEIFNEILLKCFWIDQNVFGLIKMCIQIIVWIHKSDYVFQNCFNF